jgi:hypothetical protein
MKELKLLDCRLLSEPIKNSRRSDEELACAKIGKTRVTPRPPRSIDLSFEIRGSEVFGLLGPRALRHKRFKQWFAKKAMNSRNLK